MLHQISGLVVLLALTVGTVVAAVDYCTLCPNHSMCIYKAVGASCAPRLGGGVTDVDKVAILKTHNDFRQKVAQGNEAQGTPGPQPSAANMMMMKWDTELETIAQRWADQCTFAHDACRLVPRFNVGQNIAWFGGGDPTWASAVNEWYKEVKVFNRDNISPYKFTTNTGHYTQVVWANSNLVGCGYSMYKTADDPSTTQYLYVCNYGPAGNVQTTDMYARGDPATMCPTGTARSDGAGYPALCS